MTERVHGAAEECAEAPDGPHAGCAVAPGKLHSNRRPRTVGASMGVRS
jgi:hypothetical protein